MSFISSLSSSFGSLFSFSSSSSSSTNASIASSIAEEPSHWLKKAHNECEGYDKFYPDAIAAVKTAVKILGKLKIDEDKAKYLAIKCFQDDFSCSQVEVYKSFCDREEIQTIESSYTSFLAKQKESLNQITFLRNRSEQFTNAQTLLALLPQSQITNLNLEHNTLGPTEAESIAKVLPQTQIASLNLCSNSIRSTGLQSIAQALEKTGITNLNLGWNALAERPSIFTTRSSAEDPTGIQILAKVLPQTQISLLNLERNHISTIGMQSLSLVLARTQITYLNLGGNSIGNTGAQVLAEVLAATKITYLNLSNNLIGDVGIKSIAPILAKTQIANLDLEGNCFGDTGTQCLAQGLDKTQITTLKLGDLDINNGERDFTESFAQIQINRLNLKQGLAQAIAKSRITRLSIKGNSIGDTGVTSLALVLAQTRITSLDLERSSMTATGAQILAEVLPQTQITYLNLKQNSMKDSGAQSLAQMLSQTKITRLNLGLNSIREAGAQSLAQVIAQSPVTSLNICGNSIGSAGAKSLAQVFSQNLTACLDFEDTFSGVDDELINAVAEEIIKGKKIKVSHDNNKIARATENLKAKYEEEESRKRLEELNYRIPLIILPIQSNTIHAVDLSNLKIPVNFTLTAKPSEIQLRPITAQDIKILLQALKRNTSVKSLNLSENRELKDDVIDLLIEIYSSGWFSEGNKTLLSIDLQGTGITAKGLTQLDSALQKQKLKVTLLSNCQPHIQSKKEAEEKVKAETKIERPSIIPHMPIKRAEASQTIQPSFMTSVSSTASSSSLSPTVSSISSLSYSASSTMTFQTLSTGVCQSAQPSISMNEFRKMQERLRKMEERAEKAEAEAEAAREASKKAKQAKIAQNSKVSSDDSLTPSSCLSQ